MAAANTSDGGNPPAREALTDAYKLLALLARVVDTRQCQSARAVMDPLDGKGDDGYGRIHVAACGKLPTTPLGTPFRRSDRLRYVAFAHPSGPMLTGQASSSATRS